MDPGKLDRLIKILSPTIVIDEVGDEKETWTEVLEVWAAKREVGSLEILRQPQIVGQLDAVFTIRHPDRALDSRMRIEDEAGRLYEIRGINELPGRRTGFEIQARGIDKTAGTVA